MLRSEAASGIFVGHQLKLKPEFKRHNITIYRSLMANSLTAPRYKTRL
jgi:hypothetical protein